MSVFVEKNLAANKDIQKIFINVLSLSTEKQKKLFVIKIIVILIS